MKFINLLKTRMTFHSLLTTLIATLRKSVLTSKENLAADIIYGKAAFRNVPQNTQIININ